MGFLIAWGYWIGLWASVAAVAVGTMSYVGALIPAIGATACPSADWWPSAWCGC